MELTNFQRRKVREIVSLSTDLREQLRSLSTRRSELMERIRADAGLRVQRAKEALTRYRTTTDVPALQLRLDECVAYEAELKAQLRMLEQKIEQLQPYAQLAGEFSDKLLRHSGITEDFVPASTLGAPDNDFDGRAAAFKTVLGSSSPAAASGIRGRQ
jgi:transposase